MTFGAWLTAFMHTHRIKQVHLSKSSSIHVNVIYWWMTDRNLPNGYNLALLATSLSEISKQKRPLILEEMIASILRS